MHELVGTPFAYVFFNLAESIETVALPLKLLKYKYLRRGSNPQPTVYVFCVGTFYAITVTAKSILWLAGFIHVTFTSSGPAAIKV